MLAAVDHSLRSAMRQIVADAGTENQLERFDQLLLPEHELRAVACGVLYAQLVGHRRWAKLRDNDLKHASSCNGGSASFHTARPSSLNHDEWAVYKGILRSLDQTNAITGVLGSRGLRAEPEIVEHVASCAMCGVETFARSVLVRVEWCGMTLSREYTLDP